jgi:hypothetical protein
MEKKKYIELMNKDIDKTITFSEKEELNQYLTENPDANILYNELLKTENLLDKLPEGEPSINLKKKILNSIDYSLYSTKQNKPKLLNYISAIISGTRTKLAVSFAVGLVAGIIILTVIFYDSSFNNQPEINKTYGTMGLNNANVVESVTVNTNDISGKIDISKGTNLYGFNVNLNSLKKYNLQIEYNPKNVIFDNFSLANLDYVQIDKGVGYIHISGSETPSYSLTFSTKGSIPDKFTIKIFSSEKKLFVQEIFLTNN